MSVLGPVRGLLYLARQAHAALTYCFDPYAAADWLWAELTRPRDGAKRLADAEAEVEVNEPYAPWTGPYIQRGDRVGVKLRDGSIVTGVYNPDVPGRLTGIEDLPYSSAAPVSSCSTDAAADAPRRASPYGAGHPNLTVPDAAAAYEKALHRAIDQDKESPSK